MTRSAPCSTTLCNAIRISIRLGFIYALSYTIVVNLSVSFFLQVLTFESFPMMLLIGLLYGLLILPFTLVIGLAGGCIFGLVQGLILAAWVTLHQRLAPLSRLVDSAFPWIVRACAITIQLGLVVAIFIGWRDDITLTLRAVFGSATSLFFYIPLSLTIPAAWQLANRVLHSTLGYPFDLTSDGSWEFFPRRYESLRGNPQRWYL